MSATHPHIDEVPLLPRVDVNEDGWEDEEEVEAALLRKLDNRMRAYTTLLVLAHVICNTVAIATLFGFYEALNVTRTQFGSIIAAHHIGLAVGICLFSPLKRLASKWPSMTPASAAALGVLCVLTTSCSSFFQVFAVRCVSGLIDSTLSMNQVHTRRLWYKRAGFSSTAHRVPLSNVIGLIVASLTALPLFDGYGPVMGKRIFYVNGVLIITFALYAWYRLPGHPETATWLSESERRLVTKWIVERNEQESQFNGGHNEQEPQVDGGWGARVAILTHVLKMFTLGVSEFLFSFIKSFELYWPVIFAAAAGVDVYDSGVLLSSVAPWILPAVVTSMFARNWSKLMRQSFQTFFPILFGTYSFSIVLVLVGFQIAQYANSKQLFLVSLCMIPLAFIAHVPYIWHLALATAGVTESDTPRNRNLKTRFVTLCSIAGKVVGSYVWLFQDHGFYHFPASVAASSTLPFIFLFLFCVTEGINFCKRISERLAAEPGRREMEELAGHESSV